MKFKNLQPGASIYFLEVKDTEIVGDDIKVKKVERIVPSEHTHSYEVYFTDGTMIMPCGEETYVIRGLNTLTETLKPFNFSIYSCEYDECLAAIKRISTSKVRQVTDEYKRVVEHLTKVCHLGSRVKEIEMGIKSKKEVILETVYAD